MKRIGIFKSDPRYNVLVDIPVHPHLAPDHPSRDG